MKERDQKYPACTQHETETQKIPSYANLTKDPLRTPNFVEMIELVKTQCTVFLFNFHFNN